MQAEVLVASVGEVLDTLERAEARLQAAATRVTGRVRVAVFQSAALAFMPATLRAMALRYPDVRVEMVQREPEEALRETWARDFDMVIAEQYPAHAAPHHPGLDRQNLTTDAIRLALPAETESIRPVGSLDGARHMPWVMEPRGAASRHASHRGPPPRRSWYSSIPLARMVGTTATRIRCPDHPSGGPSRS